MKTYQVVPTEGNELTKDQDGQTQKAAENSNHVENLTAMPSTKIYRRRWLMLGIFVFVSMINAFQWIQFSIITDVIANYYQVTNDDVNWTSLVYMIVYIPLIFPGAWIMDRLGLWWTVLIGSTGTALGAWIKVFSVSPDRYFVVMIGQTVVAISQVFILGVPPNVAAVWFGPEEVSSACSVGVFGNQLGVALGFLLPPVLVKIHENLDETAAELSLMFYIVAGICTVLVALVAFVFKAAPPLPPTTARILPTASSEESYGSSIKRLVTNKSYMTLLVTYGVNVGVFYAMSTLLNQIVLSHYPNEGENAGRIGLTIVFCGMVGSVVCGVILDRTHRFKETTLVVYFLAVVGMAAYTFTFMVGHIAATFVTAGAVGFFMTGYLPVGFEFAAELTYPEPEVTSSGLLNASAQAFGIVFTFLGQWLLNDYNDLVCNGTLGVALLVGAIVTIAIRSDLRRQKAMQAGNTTNCV